MKNAINKAETLRNARLFAAWYQAIPLMLNYWIGGQPKLIKSIMSGVSMTALVSNWQNGWTSREIARNIATSWPQFDNADCKRRMID